MKKNKKRKIIISNYDDIKNPFYSGGGALAIHEVAKRLAKNFQVVIVTGKYPGSKNEICDQVRYERIGIQKSNPQVGQLVYYFSLFKYFKSNDFDLWIENFTPPFSTNFLQVFTKKPVIGLVHMLSGEDMKRKYKLPFDLVEKIGVKTYKHFIVTTNLVKKKILAINPDAFVYVIPNGVNKVKNQKVKENKNKYALFLGRLEVNQKGLDLLLDAMSIIKDRVSFKLIIAGSGLYKDEQKVKQMIVDLKLEDKVKLVGRVDGEIKEKLLSQALFIVIPSRFETFSMVALESLSVGVPIISFDIEGLLWMPKKAVIKIKSFNTFALSKAMVKLSLDSSLRKRMGIVGREFSKNNTWEKAFKEYQKITYNILNHY